MYHRKKLILGVLEIFGGELSATYLQKVLFLISRKQRKKSFEFVPYKFGGFSFQANQDLNTLVKYDLLTKVKQGSSEHWILKKNDHFYNQLNQNDKSAINTIKKEIAGMDHNDLIRYTYIKYPYYAINSKIAERLLSDSELQKVRKQKPVKKETMFFTIGYEGISLEHYINKLIINDVRLLCDVRKNPISMKYGFSKSQLRNACESVGIIYKHIPELGIDSDKRKELNNLNDYRKLFKVYEKTTLTNHPDQISNLMTLTKKIKRIAITCFEKEVCMCHRGSVAKVISQSKDWNIPIKHL